MGRLWEYVKDTGALSVETWKLIASTGLARDNETASFMCPLLTRHATWVHKTQPLAAYTESLTSETFDFLTHLTITGMVRCDTTELLQLVQLKNLAVLEIVQQAEDESGVWEGPRLTDSIVREWSRSPNPFPLLRVLRVWGHDHTTINSLRYITAFPSLVLYDVAGRKRDWPEKSEQFGWKSKRKTWKTDMGYTFFQHYRLLAKGMPEDRLKPDPVAVVNTNIDLRAIRHGEKGLTPLSRDNYEAYERIFEADTNRPTYYTNMPLSFETDCICSPHTGTSAWLRHNNLWGFFMCCRIGTFASNQDQLAQGPELQRAFSQVKVVLPPRPMLQLVLGDVPFNRDPGDRRRTPGRFHCPHVFDRGVPLHRGVFETQLTFARIERHLKDRDEVESSMVRSEAVKKRPIDGSASTTYKPRKKPMSVSSILDTF